MDSSDPAISNTKGLTFSNHLWGWKLSKRLGLGGCWIIRISKLLKFLIGEISRKAFTQLDEDLFGTSKQWRLCQVKEKGTSWQPRLNIYSITSTHAFTRGFLFDVIPVVRCLITKHLKRLRYLKVTFMLNYGYKTSEEMFNFKTPNSVNTEATDLIDYYQRSIKRLVMDWDGWVLW